MTFSAKYDVLIVLVKQPKDWSIIMEGGPYRIPAQSAPPLVRDAKVRILGFYFPTAFAKHPCQIVWYGEVQDIKLLSRIEGVPDEPDNVNAMMQYYFIYVNQPKRLEQPFEGMRRRYPVHFPTDRQRFFKPLHPQINYLFSNSYLETLLWTEFTNRNIPSEREFLLEFDGKHVYLDFAIFCKEKKLNVECDGARYHHSPESIEEDKERDNLLQSKGWAILRFTYRALTKNLEDAVQTVAETVNLYGGILENPISDKPRYLKGPNDRQGRLFE